MLLSLKIIMTKSTVTLLLSSLLISSMVFVSPLVYADTIKIGLRAHHGIDKSMALWKQTADYLSEKIPEHTFIMVPYVGLTNLMEEAKQNQFDFVLTNPSSFVEMEVILGASAILTLRNKRQGKPYTKFGAVLFTRKDNADINEIKDLQGKRFIAVSKPAFGGWRVAVRELLHHGFDVYKQAGQVSFSGGIQQDVVSIIALGNADVGVVRTDMLERMAAAGLIKLDDFKIINKISSKDFPFLRSSQLYPEWPLVKMRGTSTALSKQVVLALLTMDKNHPAAIAGKYVGWTVSEDYMPVHELMKDLKVGVYEHYHESPVEYFLDEYLIEIIGFIFFMILGALVSFYIFVTNKKLVEAKRKQDQLMNELEERVKSRTHELLLEKEKAEKANNAKTEFLSSMSHELRTPMNAILGFAEILEYDVTKKNMGFAKENVNEILVAGRHLLCLVNDVLDLAQIETGKYKLDLQNILISPAIQDVIKLLTVLADKKNIEVIYNCKENDAVLINVDLGSFRQSLINIITNAIKYNKDNGKIIISFQVENDMCNVSVKDTGVGIAEENFEKIFEPFERVNIRSTIEGSGVGLSITKKLVEMMGGTLSVESQLGVGSTFILSFKTAR